MAKPMTVLVAEDHYIVALDLEQKLRKMGLDVMGPYRSVADTMTAIEEKTPDFAFLDVELIDGRSFEVAAYLNDNQKPYVFVTARLDLIEEAGHDVTRVVTKPFKTDDLVEALEFAADYTPPKL